MKPDWDRLANKFSKSPHVVIADVDCTQPGGQSVCQQAGVKGYPTLKYYVDGVQRDYQGGRGYSQLETFVSTKLGPPPPPCDVKSQKKTCSDRELRFIKKFENDGTKIKAELKTLKEKMKKKSKNGTKKKFIGHRWMNKRIDLLAQLKKNVKSEL